MDIISAGKTCTSSAEHKNSKRCKRLLKALGLRTGGVKFVSCPTCGRTKIDLIKIADEAEKHLENCEKNIIVR